MFAAQNRAATQADRRESPRDDIYYRTRATAAGIGTIGLQIVNISATGFMARSEADFANGDIVSVRLPVVGVVVAEVRWALGGRIGCQFGRMIEVAPYLEMLGELVKGARWLPTKDTVRFERSREKRGTEPSASRLRSKRTDRN